MSKNLSELSGRKGLQENLFEELGILARQEASGSPEKLKELSEKFLFGNANVYGAASFYDLTRPENKGKKVYVCNGSACLTAGTQPSVHARLSGYFGEHEIGHMTCLGRCHENGAFYYDGNNYSACSEEDLSALFDQGRKKPIDRYHTAAPGAAPIMGAVGDLEAYYGLLWDGIQRGADALLSEIKTAQIRGRGGAGFPMGFKLEACRNEVSDRKFIVCNADEGDPGAYSDRYILEHRIHALLFGMMVSGYICGAQWGVVYIRAEYPESVAVCEEAVKELYRRGWLGENIRGTGFSFDFKVIMAQGAYICGEETALLSSIEGQRPEVRTRPPFPTQKGLFNRPTVVNNVETLASVHYILEKGGAHYATLGTEKSKGTKLVSLDSHFHRPGIYEVEMGTPLRRVVDELGGGFRHEVKAMQIGGPLGGIVPVSAIDALSVDFESFAQQGFLLGHASVVCIPAAFSIVEYVEHLFEFAAYESCGKCFPCRLGTTRGHELFQKARKDGYKIPHSLLDDLLFTLQSGSLCAHGGGIPLPVRNALQHFPEEFRAVMRE